MSAVGRTTAPWVPVRWDHHSGGRWSRVPSGGRWAWVPSSSAASPKSASHTCPSGPSRTLAGLRSPCTQPAACMWARPAATPRSTRSAPSIGPPVTAASRTSLRLASARSITSAIAPSRAGSSGASTVHTAWVRTRCGWSASALNRTSRATSSPSAARCPGPREPVGSTFKATGVPSATVRASWTVPQPPEPMTAPTSQPSIRKPSGRRGRGVSRSSSWTSGPGVMLRPPAGRGGRRRGAAAGRGALRAPGRSAGRRRRAGRVWRRPRSPSPHRRPGAVWRRRGSRCGS